MRRNQFFRGIILFFLCITLSLGLSVVSCSIKAPSILPDKERISRHISSILELPSYEYVYRDIVYIAEQASFLGIKHRDTQLLFAVDVRLQAGIDLRRGFSVETISAGQVNITLPSPEILLIDADESSIHQYFKREFGGEINRLDYYDEISRSKERIQADAVSRGVLVQAGENAASIITSSLKQAGISKVNIVFSNDTSRDGIR